eukprot:6587605-Alexandrium_andersonii.AAC.1
MAAALFVDADHAGEKATSRSTSGGVVFLEAAGGFRCPIGWRSKRQSCTAASTGEAEIVAKSEGARMLGLPLADLAETFFGPCEFVCKGDAA